MLRRQCIGLQVRPWGLAQVWYWCVRKVVKGLLSFLFSCFLFCWPFYSFLCCQIDNGAPGVISFTPFFFMVTGYCPFPCSYVLDTTSCSLAKYPLNSFSHDYLLSVAAGPPIGAAAAEPESHVVPNPRPPHAQQIRPLYTAVPVSRRPGK
jgi:hypothetical protein